jgi:hypothetical protein
MRNLIYEHALRDTLQVAKNVKYRHINTDFPESRASLAFAHVSKQLRMEFLSL